MEVRPPVPPKDTPERRHYGGLIDMASSSPSFSKRKRDSLAVDDLDELAPAEHSAKKSRTDAVEEQCYESDSDPARKKAGNLRRKKGVNNLSSMSLRHQALLQEQEQLQHELRPSRFQEGSLTDKPSARPPSTYMRDGDRLIAEYDPAEHDTTEISAWSGADANEHPYPQAESGSILYRFGQKIASAFRPGPTWTKIWNETREELTLKNMAALERKRMHQEAESAGGTIKRSFGTLKRRSLANLGGFASRDSSINFVRQNGTTSQLSIRATEYEQPDQSTVRGRFHFKKPSLGNLKRARSDLHLGDTSTRESSWSVSPVKQTEDQAVLARSQSKADLRKQHKLSKRVSDLESKLQYARQELGEALAQASPMPKLVSKYDRFAGSTVRKSNFVPGMLPSLPSESLFAPALMAETPSAQPDESDASEVLNAQDQAADVDHDGTIKASKPRRYPMLASTLFEDYVDDNQPDIQEQDSIVAATMPAEQPVIAANNAVSAEVDEASIDEIAVVSQATPIKLESVTPKTTSSKKKVLNKKRKSVLDNAAYKPGQDDEEDSEPAKRSVKKRKAGVTTKMTIYKRQQSTNLTVDDDDDDDEGGAAQESSDDPITAADVNPRQSLDSSVHSLDPVYEEDEEAITVPLNDAPSKPTATATPARFGRTSRSRSPVKRNVPSKPGAEEVLLTRAATAARNHPGRQASNANEDFQWPEDVF